METGENTAADLEGVRVVVTGATSGIGAAMAQALLAAGATVGIASRPTARLTATVAAHRERGLAAFALPVDVRDPTSVDELVRRASVELGEIDVVINNAGIGMRTVNPQFFEEPQPFFEVDPEGFSDLIATNLTGYFLVARAFARGFVERGRGRFVNVTMNHSTMRRRGFVPYGPSRAGAESLSLIMAEDLRPFGVTVNMTLPGGATETGMIPDDMAMATRAQLLPASIMGPPAVFLASAEAEGLSGERLVATEFSAWLQQYRGRRASED